jgi:Transposase DDE domain
VQTAVDSEHGIIVAQQVTSEATDNRSLLPMAAAAKEALEAQETPNVLADTGYSNGEQASPCEAKGILPHVPANRGTNNREDGTLFDRTLFINDEKTDTFRCPAGQMLIRKQMLKRKKTVQYAAPVEACSKCAMKSQCTTAERRFLKRHLHDSALQRMTQRATPEAMRLRRSTVESPFAVLKYVIFGCPRFLLRGLGGAQTETSLAIMAYNLKTMFHVLGATNLTAVFAG